MPHTTDGWLETSKLHNWFFSFDIVRNSQRSGLVGCFSRPTGLKFAEAEIGFWGLPTVSKITHFKPVFSDFKEITAPHNFHQFIFFFYFWSQDGCSLGFLVCYGFYSKLVSRKLMLHCNDFSKEAQQLIAHRFDEQKRK